VPNDEFIDGDYATGWQKDECSVDEAVAGRYYRKCGHKQLHRSTTMKSNITTLIDEYLANVRYDAFRQSKRFPGFREYPPNKPTFENIS